MIRLPLNWSEIKEFSDRPTLPPGAYVSQVQQVNINRTDYGDQLCILIDISEGEYKGFYAEEFKANARDDRKWKGVLRQFLPRYDGSEKDEWSQRSLKGLATAFEHSNPGFVFNGDEQALVGKTVGILMRNEQWDYNGKTGWSVRPFRAMSADKVRSGEYTIPKDKPLKTEPAASYGYAAPYPASYGYPAAASSSFEPVTGDDDDLPF